MNGIMRGLPSGREQKLWKTCKPIRIVNEWKNGRVAYETLKEHMRFEVVTAKAGSSLVRMIDIDKADNDSDYRGFKVEFSDFVRCFEPCEHEV